MTDERIADSMPARDKGQHDEFRAVLDVIEGLASVKDDRRRICTGAFDAPKQG